MHILHHMYLEQVLLQVDDEKQIQGWQLTLTKEVWLP